MMHEEDVIKYSLNIALMIRADFIIIMLMNIAVGKRSTSHSTTLLGKLNSWHVCTVYNVVRCLPRFL